MWPRRSSGSAGSKALLYCGYIGGIGNTRSGIAADAAGNAYVTGTTGVDEKAFPVVVGPDLTYNGGTYDAFVAKVNALGTSLDYCGYIGGGGDDWSSPSIAVDAGGNAYLTGYTNSTEHTFPVAVGPDTTHNGGMDAFVAKVNAHGSALVYCGYIGGAGEDSGCGIAVDVAGSTYVAGYTGSSEQTFPVKIGPDPIYNGGMYGDAFVAKVALLDDLTASGTPRPGGTVILNLHAVEVRGIPYQVGTSLGTGPTRIDTRQIGLSVDMVMVLSVQGVLPGIFSGYSGMIDSQGQAQAAIYIPNAPALIGTHVHSAFVTLVPQAPSGITSISDTFSFVITK
jgi:hypothetical protein